MLSEADKTRVIKLVGLLGSSFENERATAARFLDEIAKQHKLTMVQLMALAVAGAAPPRDADGEAEDWAPVVADPTLYALQQALQQPRRLSAWEQDFAKDMVARYSAVDDLSEKQLAVVVRILRKVGLNPPPF